MYICEPVHLYNFCSRTVTYTLLVFLGTISPSFIHKSNLVFFFLIDSTGKEARRQEMLSNKFFFSFLFKKQNNEKTMEKEMKMIVNDTGAPLRKSKKKYAEEAHTHTRQDTDNKR